VQTEQIKNGKLTPGHVIVTRSERGNVLATHVVQEVKRVCTDRSNVHVVAKNRKSNGTVNWCMFDNAESEVQS
jgi:hypothetical protein